MLIALLSRFLVPSNQEVLRYRIYIILRDLIDVVIQPVEYSKLACPRQLTVEAEYNLGRSVAIVTRHISIEIPESILLAEKTDEVSFARELRILAAVKLYEMGRLSSGRAAELAGMSRVEFLMSLGRYKVFPFASELNDLESHAF